MCDERQPQHIIEKSHSNAATRVRVCAQEGYHDIRDRVPRHNVTVHAPTYQKQTQLTGIWYGTTPPPQLAFTTTHLLLS
jgi:hypothetical protein